MNNIATAERAIIQLGDIDLDVFQLPDGSYRLSETGCGRAIGKPENSVGNFLRSKAIEAIPFQNLTKINYSLHKERTRINGLPIDLAVAFWVCHARKGYKPAIVLLKNITESNHVAFASLRPETFMLLIRAERGKRIKSKVQKYSESWYAAKVQKKLGGQREVPTESGNIDLLTSTEIIELKEVKSWKCAIGQILVYGIYYPSHQKRIHLFGSCHDSHLNIVQKHCDTLNIKLTWEP